MPVAEAVSVPILATVPRVELGAVGVWNISNMPDWSPTPDDFANAVAALGCPGVRRPILKLGHDGEHGEGDPAIGYIDNLAITDDGMVLVGDYTGVPGWLASSDAAGRSVIASAYPDRSGEWEHNYRCQLGHTHPFVLHAVALLGVKRPGIGGLQSLHDIYTNPPEMEPLVPASAIALSSSDGKVASAATTDDVSHAFYAGPSGSSWSRYIREFFIDPPELIVTDDDTGLLLRVPYTIDGKGVITFADPQTVKATYVTARAAASAPVLAYASAREARPRAATNSGNTAGQKKGAGMDPAKLREALGLSADASDIEVASAAAALAATYASTSPTEPVAPPAPAPVVDPVAPPAPPVPAPVEPVAPAVPEGMVLLPAAAVADLQAGAAAGTRAARQLHEQARSSFLDSNRAKYLPTSRAAWEASYDRDPEGTRTYLSAAVDILPVTEQGHGGDSPAVDDSWFPGVPAAASVTLEG